MVVSLTGEFLIEIQIFPIHAFQLIDQPATVLVLLGTTKIQNFLLKEAIKFIPQSLAFGITTYVL